MRKPKPGATDKTTSFIPKKFKALTKAQAHYIKMIETSSITICVSPSGTGKTYVAVAQAFRMLQENRIDKIVITRPVVECGESLGYLPGSLDEKIHPYLLPLYDIFKEFAPLKVIESLEEEGRIEVCPLAYMRGRTFSDAVVILDEAQNASTVQLKMFLTRIGHNSRLIINGDHTQSDLDPRHSSLLEIIKKLGDMDEIAIVKMTMDDIVRHDLISKILERLGD